VGHNEQLCGLLLVIFRTIFKNLPIIFFSSNGMNFSFTSNLLKSKKKQSLFFAQGDYLLKIISQIRSQSKWGTMDKYVGSSLLLFVHFFLKFTNQSFFFV